MIKKNRKPFELKEDARTVITPFSEEPSPTTVTLSHFERVVRQLAMKDYKVSEQIVPTIIAVKGSSHVSSRVKRLFGDGPTLSTRDLVAS